jgi:hypothetical protein
VLLALAPSPVIVIAVAVVIAVEPPVRPAVVTRPRIVAPDLVEQFLQARVLLPLRCGRRVPFAPFFGRALHPLGLFLVGGGGGAMKSAA